MRKSGHPGRLSSEFPRHTSQSERSRLRVESSPANCLFAPRQRVPIGQQNLHLLANQPRGNRYTQSRLQSLPQQKCLSPRESLFRHPLGRCVQGSPGKCIQSSPVENRSETHRIRRLQEIPHRYRTHLLRMKSSRMAKFCPRIPAQSA